MSNKQRKDTRTPIGGGFEGQFRDAIGNVRTTVIDGCTIRVWGAESGRGIASELVPPLRRMISVLGAEHPFALMADHHPAVNGIVGSVVPSSSVIWPKLIGSDCGCGVFGACLPVPRDRLSVPVLEELFRAIHRCVPVGRFMHEAVLEHIDGHTLWPRLEELSWISRREVWKLKRQLGTLGGGNHFLEIAETDGGEIWVLVHSGSRYLGGLLSGAYGDERIAVAEDQASATFFRAQQLVLEYAAASRLEMARRTLECLRTLSLTESDDLDAVFDLSHNFVSQRATKDGVLVLHRKGACAAEDGQVGIIPGSMSAGSYLVVGRGAEIAYWSSSHGAGRALSRGEAFRRISLRSFENEMRGIVWSGSERLKDEAPQAYKPLDGVMRGQSDLVAVRSRLTPLLVIKGER